MVRLPSLLTIESAVRTVRTYYYLYGSTPHTTVQRERASTVPSGFTVNTRSFLPD